MEPLKTSINNSAINSKVLIIPLIRCDDQVIKQEIIDETDQNNDNQSLQIETLCQFEEKVIKTETKIKKEIDVINGFVFEGSVLTEDHSLEFITRLNADVRSDSRKKPPKPVSKSYKNQEHKKVHTELNQSLQIGTLCQFEEKVIKTETKIKKEIDVINGFVFEGSVLTEDHSLEFITRLNADVRSDSRKKPPKPVSKSYKNQEHKKVHTELNHPKPNDEILTSKVKIHNSKLEKSFVCDYCNKSYHSKSAIRTHMIKHSGKRPYKCDICDKMFKQPGHLKNHMRSHTGEKPYKCDVCKQAFARADTLRIHTRTHTGEKPYKCDVCDKRFICKQHVICHSRIHTGDKPFECDICDKRFSSTSSLRRHVRVHTGERRFKCDNCDQEFSQLIHLKVHMRKHTGERPYKCYICKRAFSHSANLKKHIKIHSIQNSCHKCDVCGKGFCNSSSLNVHSRTHTGEKRFKCDICDHMFSQAGNLKSHMRLHTGEKPYKCDICKRAFSRAEHVKSHMKTHAK